jgi:hypothetical protein
VAASLAECTQEQQREWEKRQEAVFVIVADTRRMDRRVFLCGSVKLYGATVMKHFAQVMLFVGLVILGAFGGCLIGVPLGIGAGKSGAGVWGAAILLGAGVGLFVAWRRRRRDRG